MEPEMKLGAYTGRCFQRDDDDDCVAECDGERFVQVEYGSRPDAATSYIDELL